jgi:hypothetical protein
MGRRMKVYGTNSIDGFFFTLIAQHTHNLQCRVTLVSIKKAVLTFVKRGMWVGVGCAQELGDVGILV